MGPCHPPHPMLCPGGEQVAGRWASPAARRQRCRRQLRLSLMSLQVGRECRVWGGVLGHRTPRCRPCRAVASRALALMQIPLLAGPPGGPLTVGRGATPASVCQPSQLQTSAVHRAASGAERASTAG